MNNPLEQFFPVETRPDGIYIKVDRILKESLHPDTIIESINKSGVMNFNRDRFLDVFLRSRGVFEKIGPPFEYYDEELEKYVNILMTPLKVSVKIAEDILLKCKMFGAPQLLFFLKRKGIVHGIDNEMVKRIVEESLFGNYVDVASATPPENGLDGRVEIKVDVNPEIKPKIRSDGSVDYRSIQTFTSVSKGDLLAVKHPPTPGRPGITVFGEPIASNPGKEICLPQGRNTEITSDGTRLIASTTGIVFFENSLLSIAELLHVKKDVDFSVGNVKYTGDVMIGGNVKPGFTIEAEGSIHIRGEVESARIISRAGYITIEKGVVGKGDTIISAKEGIHLCFAQEAQIRTEGVLSFEKYLLHCKVICGSIESKGGLGSIVGGDIKAEKSVVVRVCGNEKNILTRISIFDRNKSMIKEKLNELTQLQQKLTGELEPIERQLKTKASLMKRAGEEVTDRHREEVKKWIDAYNEMKKKIDYVNEKITELKTALEKPGDRDGFVQVSDRCYPGTNLSLYDITRQIQSVYINKKFILKNNIITTSEE